MKRQPVSIIQPRWFDGQRVDQTDMNSEQSRNSGIDASIIDNHFGSGVLPTSFFQNIIFDSDSLTPDQVALVASRDFDGTGISATTQPSDPSLGNQLEVEYLDSDIYGPAEAFGRITSKVFIIGTDFQGNLQYETFTFAKKEKQVSRKHFSQVVSIMFNDFKGNDNCSRNLAGRFIIRESASFELSRDPIMISQDVQPNLFFRDFKVSHFTTSSTPVSTLNQALQQAIGPAYSVDSLGINTSVLINYYLKPGDVTTKVGQKFQAQTNNIQNISILLGASSADYATVPIGNRFDWSGELIVTVYSLQTSVTSPTDLVPGLAIEFDPNPVPITQFTFDQASLADQGYVLNDVLQPVDLIFSNSILGNTINSTIVPGQYYAVSISRAGNTSNGTLFTGIGASVGSNARMSVFSGGSWTDIPEQSLWYRVWTDASKIADGNAYDSGNGISIAKTTINDIGASIDYCFGLNPFSDTGQNTLNTGIIEAIQTQSVIEQDERTGDNVYSRTQFQPSFSFVTNSALTTLKQSENPVIIGTSKDTNPRNNSIITGLQSLPGLAKGDTFIVINPDADLLSQQLIGSKLIPDDTCEAVSYRIYGTKICTDGYGDVNGDGIIDVNDLNRATQLLGEALSLSSTQQKIRDGYFTILEFLKADVNGDGYISSADITLLTNYISRTIQSFPVGQSFRHLEIRVQQSIGRYDSYYDCDGYIRNDGYLSSQILDPAILDPSEVLYDGNFVPVEIQSDPVFTTIPFVPVPFKVTPQPFWKDYLILTNSQSRLVPAAFTSFEDTPIFKDENGDCLSQIIATCSDVFLPEVANPGRNDLFVPNNLVIGNGQITNPDGTLFRQDIEINNIVLEFPAQAFNNESINIFLKLVAHSNNGLTSAGFNAMRFADCSYVGTDALLKNQVRFGVSIQSVVPNIDGYSSTLGYGVVVDDVVGVYMDYGTGIMTLTAKDMWSDPVYQQLITKIQITVYLKKSGWTNFVTVVSPTQVAGLFV